MWIESGPNKRTPCGAFGHPLVVGLARCSAGTAPRETRGRSTQPPQWGPRPKADRQHELGCHLEFRGREEANSDSATFSLPWSMKATFRPRPVVCGVRVRIHWLNWAACLPSSKSKLFLRLSVLVAIARVFSGGCATKVTAVIGKQPNERYGDLPPTIKDPDSSLPNFRIAI